MTKQIKYNIAGNASHSFGEQGVAIVSATITKESLYYKVRLTTNGGVCNCTEYIADKEIQSYTINVSESI